MSRRALRAPALFAIVCGAVVSGTFASGTVVLSEGIARADEPGPHAIAVSVLGIDSDDAEEQADALTSTLRSRVRAAPGWSLGESVQPLGILTAALKCPQRPDGACEQRIAEQLKTDNYIWGVMRKAPGGNVNVELHYFSKGKPVQVASSTYAENLKDQNDDALRREASGLLGRLRGNTVGGITVHAASAGDGAELVVDDARHEPLKNGTAHVEVMVGPHAVEVSSKAFPSQRTTLNVTAGHDSLYEPTFGAPAEEAAKPFPTRKIIGGAAAVVGVGATITSIVLGLKFKSLQDDQATKLKSIPSGQDACKLEKTTGPGQSAAIDACNYYNDHNGESSADSALAWVFGGVAVVGIGVGAYLLFTDGAGEKTEAPAQTGVLSNLRVLPTVGPRGGSMALTGSF